MEPYVLTKEESSRIKILKFVAIIFVVYIHSYTTDTNFSEGTLTIDLPKWLLLIEDLISSTMARLAVPLFFLISSVLLFKNKRDYKKTIVGKVHTLLIPYLIWNSLWILVFILLQNIPFTAQYFSGEKTPILQYSVIEWLNLYGVATVYPLDYPLWYIRDLMIVTLFFPIIDKLASKFPKLLFFAVALLTILPIDIPMKRAWLWFTLGACIVKLNIHLSSFDKIPLWPISAVYAAMTAYVLLAGNVVIDGLYIFVGLIFWCRASKPILEQAKISDAVLKLSEWIFIIFAAHEMTLSCIKKVCLRLLPTEPVWLLTEYFLLPVIVMCGCCAAGAILKKTMPKVYNVLTGSR